MFFSVVMYGCWTIKKAGSWRIDSLNCGVGEDSWESHGLQPTRLLHLWDFPGKSTGVGCPSPPAFNLSQHQGLFQWVHFSYQMAKILNYQLQHQFSIEYSELISFRIDWLDLLAVQETLKSLLQHHSSIASFLGAQPSLRSISHICTWLLEKS